MKTAKRVTSLLISVIMLVSVFSVGAFAAIAQKSYNGKYGRVIPVNSTYKKVCKTFNIKGESGKLYFKMDSKGYKKNVYYYFAIFSDAEMKNAVMKNSGAFPTVDSKISVSWNVKTFDSGTYYGKTYTYVKTSSGNVIDKDSIYTYTINVNRLALTQPKITLVQSAAAGVIIKWNTLKYADNYKVYRKTAGASWKAIKTTAGKSYIDSTALSGVEYYYTVKALDNGCASKYNKGVPVMRLSSPVFVKTPVQEGSSISFSWEAVNGAESYRVYRKVYGAPSYTRIATLSGDVTEYSDDSAKTDKTSYVYVVRAVSGITAGTLSKARTVTYYDSLDINYVYCDNNTVTVRWNMLDGADKYSLYRRMADTGEWQLIFESTDVGEYIDTGIKRGDVWYYSAVAEIGGIKTGFDSAGVPAAYLSNTVITSLANGVNNSVAVKWDAVEGAQGYNIYRKGPNDEYALVGTVGNKTQFNDYTEKQNNLRYTYAVEPVSESSSGELSEGVSVIFMKAPKLISAVADNGGNLIKWEGVPGATAYEIYRKTASGEWILLAVTEDIYSYFDTTASSGTGYYYTVASMNGTLGGSFESGLYVKSK